MDGRTKQLITRTTPKEHARIMNYAATNGTTASALIRDFIDSLDDAPATQLEAIMRKAAK